MNKAGYPNTYEETQFARLWGLVLPRRSEARIRAIIGLGLDLVLFGPNIEEAAQEGLIQAPKAKAQKPHLALALLGHNRDTAISEEFRQFRSTFNVKEINDFYDMEYSNFTLNVSGIFNPGAGIYIHENHRLLDGSKAQLLHYPGSSLRAIEVESLWSNVKCLNMSDGSLFRTLGNKIGSAHFCSHSCFLRL